MNIDELIVFYNDEILKPKILASSVATRILFSSPSLILPAPLAVTSAKVFPFKEKWMYPPKMVAMAAAPPESKNTAPGKEVLVSSQILIYNC